MKRRDEKEQKQLVAKFKASGMTMTAFAKKIGIPPGTLGYYVYKDGGGKKVAKKGKAVNRFVSLNGHADNSRWQIKVGTATLVAPENISADELKNVLASLGAE